MIPTIQADEAKEAGGELIEPLCGHGELAEHVYPTQYVSLAPDHCRKRVAVRAIHCKSVTHCKLSSLEPGKAGGIFVDAESAQLWTSS